MSKVEIKDEMALRAWLETQSIEICCAMASRSALRVISNISNIDEYSFRRLAIDCFRETIISAVRGLGRTADIAQLNDSAFSAACSAAPRNYLSEKSGDEPALRAADFAAHSADCSADAARSSSVRLAAVSAASSAAHSTAKLSAAYSAITLDANYKALNDFKTPLWPNGDVPNVIQRNLQKFLRQLESDRKTWGFWHDWYLAMWEGRFEDWDLATEVAMIPDEVWDKGPEAVAVEIEIISEKLLSLRLPQAEILFEDENGLYDVRSAIADPSKLTQSVLSRVQFAFDMAIESNSCDLNAMSLPAKTLRHVLDNCTDDPNTIEQLFRRTSAIIRKKVADGQFADDDELALLVDLLDECALQMRADHPEVSAASETRIQQTLKEISDEKRLEIAKRMQDMVDGTAPRLAAEYELAAETTRNNEAIEAQANAIKVGGERAAKISMLERAKQFEGSGTMAGVKMGMRAKKLVEIVLGSLSGLG